MKVSLNALSRDVPEPIIDTFVLIDKIGTKLAAVETIIPFGAKYEAVIIVRVVDCWKHGNSDHLNVCKIDAGAAMPDIARDSSGYIQVVCGAPNVRAGLTVAWLPPGATVPSSFNTEPFVLSVREIRGEISNGMLASPKELALGDSHEGILEIDGDIAPGTAFADQYNLVNDVVIDMENKMFTHRPDCFGTLGIAREVAGIQGQAFTSPDWYSADATLPAPDTQKMAAISAMTDTNMASAPAILRVEVRNEIPELVPRFVAIPLAGITITPSPVWLQVELSRLGVRPINNIVDLTNYYMLLTGQPLHAYDYDKVVAQDATDDSNDVVADRATLVIRHPQAGEKLLLLNGKDIEPRSEAILIASATKAIGLGGVMGGGDTEVTAHTTRIILESASFDMYSIRRTSMAHGIFSEAVTRFNKGQSPLQNAAVLAKIVANIIELTGAVVGGETVDNNHLSEAVKERGSLHEDVVVTAGFIRSRLGIDLSAQQMAVLLTNVEFQVQIDDDTQQLTIRAPFWRTDIEIPEDIVEEVGRLYGFDQLPLVLPERNITPATRNPLLELTSRLRRTLATAGASELLTYSFVDGKLLDTVGQNKQLAYKLSNALSPDLQYYRLSLTPSLLDKVHPNIKAGYDTFGIFEIGKAHVIGEPDPAEPAVPKEVHSLSFVYSSRLGSGLGSQLGSGTGSKLDTKGAAYYQAKLYLQTVLTAFQAAHKVSLEPLIGADLYNNPWLIQMTAPFEPARSAVLRDGDGLVWGVVGEYKASVRRALKLPDYSAGFEIDPLLLLSPTQLDGVTSSRQVSPYVMLPRFPKIQQDITLRVAADLPYQRLYDYALQAVHAQAPDKITSIEPLDIYQKPGDDMYRHITLRCNVSSYDRTLTDSEVATLLDTVAAGAASEFGAQRI